MFINHKITYDTVMKQTPLPPLSLFWQVRGGNVTALRRPCLPLSAVTISLHYLPRCRFQQSHAAKRQYCNSKLTEHLLPCYCYTIKTNSQTTRSQVWQTAPGLPPKLCLAGGNRIINFQRSINRKRHG